jgi:hypothetical protein
LNHEKPAQLAPASTQIKIEKIRRRFIE